MNAKNSHEQSRWVQIRSIVASAARTRGGAGLILLGASAVLMGLATLIIGAVYLWGVPQTAEKQTQIIPVESTPEPDRDRQTQVATLSLATQTCPAPGLVLGERTFAVQTLELVEGGGLPAPPESSQAAYLVIGTETHMVFVLGTAAFGEDTAALQSLTEAKYMGENCSTSVYQLAPPQPAPLKAAGLINSLESELAIFVQVNPDGTGFLLQGTKKEEPTSPAVPLPDEAKVKAEIGVIDVQPSTVGRLVRVKVSVYNYGATALELTANDMSLLVEGGKMLGPSGSKPALPELIQPSRTVDFDLIFPLPGEGLGILRILSAEFELGDFVK